MAASSDAGVAEQVTERVLLADPGGDSDVLVALAVLLAVRTSPHAALSRMRVEEREVIALARLARATTNRIAVVLALEPKAVRALMTSGLRALINRDGAPRMPPPLPGCGCGASPGHAARAS